MEKLSLGVLNAEASEEGQAALEQAVSFLWAHGFCVSESSPARLSREQKLTIPHYTVESRVWLRCPPSTAKPWDSASGLPELLPGDS